MLIKCVVALLRHPALAGIMDPPGEEREEQSAAAAGAAAGGPEGGQGGPGAAAAGPGPGTGRRMAPNALSRLTGNDPCTQLPGVVLRMLCAELREARCVARCGGTGQRACDEGTCRLGRKGLCWWRRWEHGRTTHSSC